VRFGVQTALQHTTPEELRRVWRRAEGAGFDWISVWDHFYAVGGGTHCLEAVSMHTLLAAETTRVQVGGLVYSVGYRSVPVLAKSLATIDQIAGGRAVLGLGAGYLQAEYDAFGLPFPGPGERLDQLAETVAALRALFAGRAVTQQGRYVELRDAVCDPPPARADLPIWIGGGGEQRTIPLAARVADGWNVPMATLEDFTRKCGLLRRSAEAAGRDPASVASSVGVGLCFDATLVGERFGARAELLRPAILTGTDDEVTERVAAYGRAGADWLFVSLRAPFDTDELDRFAERVVPELR
jgi:alkanesulfonate monooxygenase SsuD/methylene tetrahydromethanopterin reductase-like flavin-dependent oxidoreductase (luciferase family)